MNPEQQAHFEKELNTLRAHYIARLKQDMAMLEAFRKQLETGMENSKDYEEMSLAVHKMSGAGGVFGFSEISHPAAELEAALRERKPKEILLPLLRALQEASRRAIVG